MLPYEQLQAENSSLREELAVLKAQIAWLQRQLFGPGKSEKLDRAQMLLQLQALEGQAEALEATSETIHYERKKGKRAARKPTAENFAHLPVKETIEVLPDEVQANPDAFERIGEERTYEVDITPPKLFKREIVRPKFRAKADRARPPIVAPAPARPVDGGYASAGLIAWVLLGKYVEHLPLYRQEKMSRYWGASISRQVMTDWVRIAADWLEIIYKQMRANLMASGYIQVDETPIRCHDPDLKRGQTSQGWMWVISAPGGDVLFDWRESRRHDEASSLLKGYHGLLQSDGYRAYPSYAQDRDEVVWLGCWAHARRKFFDAQAESRKAVRVILKLIARMYHLESFWDEAGIGPTERAELRAKHFARTLKWLRAIAQRQLDRVPPKSLLGKACAYLLRHWAPLTEHLNHGRTRLDTNLVENAIRPSAIGKKNWLFIGHRDAGQRSAIIYSIVVSCQRHGADPLAYLRDVLTRLPGMTNQDDLSTLTPKKWAKSSAQSQ